MIRLVTRGRFTQSFAKGFIQAPEDREPAIRKMVESVGGKLISFYFTTGDHDFLLITEAPDAESIMAAVLGTGSSGMVTDMSTVRGWTPAEFKPVAEKAAKAAAAYRAPGLAREPEEAVWSG